MTQASARDSDWLTGLWYVAALSRSLQRGRTQRVWFMNEPIALARDQSGRVYAMRDICPHRGAPLSAGRFLAQGDEAQLACPYHGWRFRLTDGRCAAIPSLMEGQDFPVGKIAVRTLPVSERDGLIWLYAAPDGQLDAPPPAPALAARDFGAPFLAIERQFACDLDQAIIGTFDPAHGPYVHRQFWWRQGEASLRPKTKAYHATKRGFAMTRHPASGNSGVYRVAFGARPEVEIRFDLPSIRVEQIWAGGVDVLALSAATPQKTGQTAFFQVFYTTSWRVRALAPLIGAAANRFLDQDQRILALQAPGLTLQPRAILVDDADQPLKWYLQLKRAWVQAQAERTNFANPITPRVLHWRT